MPTSKAPPPAVLLSVTDKTGIVEFATSLQGLGYILLSTGGTAKVLQQAGLEVTPVSEFTGFQEILGGRVKTLHPRIHASIMWDREDSEHERQMSEYNGSSIDMVVVNLYDFQANAVGGDLTPQEAIEHIDIGGPTMLRAAAKNFRYCLPVIDPADYETIVNKLRSKALDQSYRQRLAAKTFARISAYDAMIASYFDPESATRLPTTPNKKMLRYGENPHQTAEVFAWHPNEGLAGAEPIQGKELSYNNYLDLHAALGLARDLNHYAATVIIKHNNPCGAAISTKGDLLDSYTKALACDPVSAFGSVIAFTRRVEAPLAQTIAAKLFVECIVAPDFSREALQIFSEKKNMRLLVADMAAPAEGVEFRSIDGGFLTQTADKSDEGTTNWQYVTKVKVTEIQKDDLLFANTVAKHVKSNTLVFVRDGKTIAIGAGQMSRIDAAKIAVRKSSEVYTDDPKPLAGSVMASDAFFPFRDTVDFVSQYGVKAIIQPGGSMRDQESIDACYEHGIAMVFTGQRHFRH